MISRARTMTMFAALMSLAFSSVAFTAPIHGQTAPASQTYTQDDVAHVSALDLMEGHLQISLELWNLQQYDLAAKHTGQTVSELFSTVESALKTAGMDATLRAAIDAYTAIAGKAGDANQVKAIHQALLDTIHAAQQAIVSAQATADPNFQGEVIRRSLDVATSEYADATVESSADQLIDYQASDGFISVAEARYQRIGDTAIKPKDSAADTTIDTQFIALEAVYPNVMKPPTPLEAADKYKEIADTISDTLTKVLNLPPDTFRSVDRAINTVKDDITQALSDYKAGDATAAYELAVSAYLDNFESLEGDLAKKDANLVSTLEGQFKDLRDGFQAQKTIDDLTTLAQSIETNLDKAEALLTNVSPASSPLSTAQAKAAEIPI